MKRGFTLIEAMIAVAVSGILATSASVAIDEARAVSTDLVLNERARQLLDVEASSRVAGTIVRNEVRNGLLAELPGAWFKAEAVVDPSLPRGRRAVRLSVHWRSARERPRSLEVVVLERAP